MEPNIFSLIGITLQDAARRRWLVLLVFACFSFLALYVGLHFPKIFRSSVTVFVEEQNILGPLMEGAAVQSGLTIDRARIAKEIIFGRSFLSGIVEKAGWVEAGEDKDKLVESIKQNITIENFKANLIRIEHQGSDPDRVFETTQLLADTFITESLKDKVRESRSAFEFINSESKKYRVKLQKSEEKLNEFYNENAGVSQDSEQSISMRINELRAQRGQIEQDIREAEIRRSSMQRQINGEAEDSSALTIAGEYRARISDLETQVDALRLNYHDTHPDIIQLTRQIEDLRTVLVKEEEKSRARKNQANRAGGIVIDEKLLANPVYQQLRQNYYDANTQVTTLTSRLGQVTKLLENEYARSKLVHKLGSDLIELKRDYDANNGIYQDLLKRREIARVSMNLDEEQKGLTLRIDEPAFFPNKPVGPGLLMFILGGWALGLVIPIAVIFLKVKIQGRIYDPLFLSQQMGLPVLATISIVQSASEKNLHRVATFSFFVVTLLVVSSVIGIAIMHVQGIISL